MPDSDGGPAAWRAAADPRASAAGMLFISTKPDGQGRSQHAHEEPVPRKLPNLEPARQPESQRIGLPATGVCTCLHLSPHCSVYSIRLAAVGVVQSSACTFSSSMDPARVYAGLAVTRS
jgi:hypothetical protein